MKPNEGNEIENADLIGQVGLLILEGRKLNNVKTNMKDSFTNCEDIFKSHEKLQKDFLSMWGSCESMFLEVWLHQKEQFNEKEAISGSDGFLLLEQWHIEITPNRNPKTVFHCTEKMLFQAVESKLYFSQLSAWLSLSRGVFPRHTFFSLFPIPYHSCVPRICNTKEEVPLYQFIQTPEFHQFPEVQLNSTDILKVSIYSLPHSDLQIDHSALLWVLADPPGETPEHPKSGGAFSSFVCNGHDTCRVARKLEFGVDFSVEDNSGNNLLENDKNLDEDCSIRKMCPKNRDQTNSFLVNFDKKLSLSKQRTTTFQDRNKHDTRDYVNSYKSTNEKISECDATSNRCETNRKDDSLNEDRNISYRTESRKCSREEAGKSSATIQGSAKEDLNDCTYTEVMNRRKMLSCSSKVIEAGCERKNTKDFHQQAPKRSKNKDEYGSILQRTLKKENKNVLRVGFENSCVCNRKSLIHDGENRKEDVFSDGKFSAIPHKESRDRFRHSSTGTLAVFHPHTGLPVSSSPAPFRKTSNDGQNVDDICRLQREKTASLSHLYSHLSKSAPTITTQSLLVNFEESVLNDRLLPDGVVEGFTAELSASGSKKCLPHVTLPVQAYFFRLSDDNAPSPYMGYISLNAPGLSRKGYHVPKKGTIQLTLFNPNQTVVKVFVILYDFSDMKPYFQTCLRQKTTSIVHSDDNLDRTQDNLHYLIHLRFASSKSGRIYLHTDIRVIFARHPPDQGKFVTTTRGPTNPKYVPRHNSSETCHK